MIISCQLTARSVEPDGLFLALWDLKRPRVINSKPSNFVGDTSILSNDAVSK